MGGRGEEVGRVSVGSVLCFALLHDGPNGCVGRVGDKDGAGNPFNLALLLQSHQVVAISGSACSQCSHHIPNLAELLFRLGK